MVAARMIVHAIRTPSRGGRSLRVHIASTARSIQNETCHTVGKTASILDVSVLTTMRQGVFWCESGVI